MPQGSLKKKKPAKAKIQRKNKVSNRIRKGGSRNIQRDTGIKKSQNKSQRAKQLKKMLKETTAQININIEELMAQKVKQNHQNLRMIKVLSEQEKETLKRTINQARKAKAKRSGKQVKLTPRQLVQAELKKDKKEKEEILKEFQQRKLKEGKSTSSETETQTETEEGENTTTE